MRKTMAIALGAAMLGAGVAAAKAADSNALGGNMMISDSIAEDTRVFKADESIKAVDVRFKNRFGIELAGHLYYPADFDPSKRYSAIAASGPFGAVKEQVSGLYAQSMAKRGFLAVAFDPSFTGESGGEPRQVASPDINTEDFIAAVDFLSVQPCADPGRIAIIGVCGWGGMAINAAALDPRIRATVTVTMYDMSRVSANDYNDAGDNAASRNAKRKAISAQRTEDFREGGYKYGGGVPAPEALPEDAPQFMRDYADFYKTKRGYHPRSGGSNNGWRVTGCQSFLNQPMLCYAHEIEAPVLLIHGENAHSRYFSEGAFEKMTCAKPDGKSMTAGNKEIMIIPGIRHCELYDDLDVIPFSKIEAFINKSLD